MCEAAVVDDDVAKFLDSVGDEQRQRDARLLVALMGEVTGQPAAMWGSSIIGFGTYHYRYASPMSTKACCGTWSRADSSSSTARP